MPSLDIHTCQSCGFVQETIIKSFWLAPEPESSISKPEELEWLKRTTMGFICDGCDVILTLPQMLDATDWQRWKSTKLPRELEFETSLVERIDAGIADKPHWAVDLGLIACPYCQQHMEKKDKFEPTCKKCGSHDLKWTDWGIATLDSV